ncbi:helix-turn-helix domain-containing protein [Paenibacillus allorhizosphaerae]|uniref:HTH-type transcriptional regulator YesS n=1 Tax=Paenibacillus allorhizosphaerae TaxID=2849866 RepID=A0ABM8VGE1_9BACL|nr:helix-turn-helix domain-containing protein [Paenibacillus allorhizosphaerae]CAG7638213.1 HTH-type transcriptional regulator YesS [Paenibacillus allorhizosphaerae]
MWKAIRRGTNGHRVFLRLLVPNMLFLLLPLLVGWVIYNKTLQEMEKEVTTGNMHLLQQSRDILDRRFAEISSIATQLAGDPRIMQFQPVTEPFEGANTYRILDTRKSLYNYGLTNNFIFSYFVLYKNSELVLTENSTYGLEEFTRYFQYSGMELGDWKSTFLERYHTRKVLPARDVDVRGGHYSLLTYIQSLGFPGAPQGAIAVTADNREIQKLLGGLDLSGGGWAYITDENGAVVSEISSGTPNGRIDRGSLPGKEGSVPMKIGSRDMLVTYTTSAYNAWTYMVAQPAHVVLEKVLYIKKITFTMAFIFLAAGLLIAYLIAYRNSRPLRSIIETIMERTDGEAAAGSSGSPGSPGADAYRFIRESVSRLIDNNRELQEKMKAQAPLLQAALFERLLKGEYVSLEDHRALLQHVGVETEGNYFAVAILQLRGYDGGLNRFDLEALDVKRVMVKDILHEALGASAHWHDVAEDRIALLFVFRFAHTQHIREYLAEAAFRISETIQHRLYLATRFAIGGVHEDLLNVSRSYEEARQTLEYLLWRNRSGPMQFEELPIEHNSYYYPSDFELRLGNLAKAGDLQAVESMLQELYDINFKERRLSVPMLRLFMNEMWGTIVKMLPQVGMDERNVFEQMKPFSGDMSSFEGLDHNYRALVETYRHVCGFVGEHKKSQNVQLMDNIIRLLQDGYVDQELCLEAVADRMDISKGYLSQFFKEQTGVNFSDYLESLRMTQAKVLLADTDLPVYEIAERVGYSSSNTFCRAFKRINGISTTAYRRSHAG